MMRIVVECVAAYDLAVARSFARVAACHDCRRSFSRRLVGDPSARRGDLRLLFPTCVAAHRKHNNESAILALNLFLGWTLLGWVIALVWALTDNTSA
jgi:hypothetical protein